MWEVKTSRVIIHNNIVEDECDEGLLDQGWQFQGELVVLHAGSTMFEEFIHVHHVIGDLHTHD
jgi:hypothetical protein